MNLPVATSVSGAGGAETHPNPSGAGVAGTLNKTLGRHSASFFRHLCSGLGENEKPVAESSFSTKKRNSFVRTHKCLESRGSGDTEQPGAGGAETPNKRLGGRSGRTRFHLFDTYAAVWAKIKNLQRIHHFR